MTCTIILFNLSEKYNTHYDESKCIKKTCNKQLNELRVFCSMGPYLRNKTCNYKKKNVILK